MEFKVGKVNFNNSNCVIIAEAGVNHLGDLKLAEKLISSAAKAGADIIKFQTYKAKELTTRKAPRFWNWEGEIKKGGTQYDSYSVLDTFGKKEHLELRNLCEEYDIEFISAYPNTDRFPKILLERVEGNGGKLHPMRPNMMAFMQNKLNTQAKENGWQQLPYVDAFEPLGLKFSIVLFDIMPTEDRRHIDVLEQQMIEEKGRLLDGACVVVVFGYNEIRSIR